MSIREVFALLSYWSMFVVAGLFILLILLWIWIAIKRSFGSPGGSAGAAHGSRNGGVGPRN